MRLPTERVMRLGMPSDRFIEHGSRREQLAEAGLDAAGLVAAVRQAIGSRAEDLTRAAHITARTLANRFSPVRPPAQP
jgi:hypothetical protein